MSKKEQEQRAIRLLIGCLHSAYSMEVDILKEGGNDFPDFILRNRSTGEETWVEVVEAVESGELRAAEAWAWRHYQAAAQAYRARGEEVVIEVTRRGVERITPSPGSGVCGLIMTQSFRPICPQQWIQKALERKRRAYGPIERARTTLLIDCSEEPLFTASDATEVLDDLRGETLGFKEIWGASANWPPPQAIMLSPTHPRGTPRNQDRG